VNIVLFDSEIPVIKGRKLLDKQSFYQAEGLYPMAITRAVSMIRVGILTIFEKWQKLSPANCFIQSKSYLQALYAPLEANLSVVQPTIYVSAHIIPQADFVHYILSLQAGDLLLYQGKVIAYFPDPKTFQISEQQYTAELSVLRFVEDIFLLNEKEIRQDYTLLTAGRESAPLSGSNQVLGQEVFIEEGARIECATLNSINGPIYIAKNALIMEGSHIRGPFYLGESATVKMGACIYGNVSVGKYSTVGGELNHVVLGDFTAKGHHGYLGCSVLGDWCNLGAGTSNSNLKNNFSTVQLYQIEQSKFRETNLQKCGLFMGDFTRCSINSSFNTGSIVGVGNMLASTLFYPKYIGDFKWIAGDKQSDYRFEKFISDLEVVFLTKKQKLNSAMVQVLYYIKNKTNYA